MEGFLFLKQSTFQLNHWENQICTILLLNGKVELYFTYFVHWNFLSSSDFCDALRKKIGKEWPRSTNGQSLAGIRIFFEPDGSSDVRNTTFVRWAFANILSYPPNISHFTVLLNSIQKLNRELKLMISWNVANWIQTFMRCQPPLNFSVEWNRLSFRQIKFDRLYVNEGL